LVTFVATTLGAEDVIRRALLGEEYGLGTPDVSLVAASQT
jgi:hypothetical protein